MSKYTKDTSRFWIADHPYIDRLIATYGLVESSRMLGISDVNSLVREKHVRPCHELAAKMLITDAEPVTHSRKSIVISGDCNSVEMLIALCDRLGVQYLDITDL